MKKKEKEKKKGMKGFMLPTFWFKAVSASHTNQTGQLLSIPSDVAQKDSSEVGSLFGANSGPEVLRLGDFRHPILEESIKFLATS